MDEAKAEGISRDNLATDDSYKQPGGDQVPILQEEKGEVTLEEGVNEWDAAVNENYGQSGEDYLTLMEEKNRNPPFVDFELSANAPPVSLLAVSKFGQVRALALDHRRQKVQSIGLDGMGLWTFVLMMKDHTRPDFTVADVLKDARSGAITRLIVKVAAEELAKYSLRSAAATATTAVVGTALTGGANILVTALLSAGAGAIADSVMNATQDSQLRDLGVDCMLRTAEFGPKYMNDKAHIENGNLYIGPIEQDDFTQQKFPYTHPAGKPKCNSIAVAEGDPCAKTPKDSAAKYIQEMDTVFRESFWTPGKYLGKERYKFYIDGGWEAAGRTPSGTKNLYVWQGLKINDVTV